MRFLWGWLTVSAVSSTCLAAADFDRTLFERTSDTTTRRLDQPGGLTCFDSLIFSDVDFDRKVTKTEYITFLELFGPDNFLPEGTDTFDDLPLVLKSNFLILACLCQQQPGADPNCCVGDAAHLSNMGAAPDESPTGDEAKSLSQICFLSDASINRSIGTVVPTTPPVAVPTRAPIAAPTRAPIAPVTPSPTPLPTKPPTRRPTSAPSRTTTVAPTKGPTFPPTMNPTVADTPAPTTPAPTTPAPTIAPTTESPSASPTIVGAGSLIPSDFPSLVPTSGPTTTSAPSRRSADAIVLVSYVIARRGDATPDVYVPSLVAAMDILAPQIAANQNLISPTGRRLRVLQVAQIEVLLPTSIDQISVNTVCPSSVPSTDSCEDIVASIELYVTDPNITQVREAFESSLIEAISDGELQSFLEVVDPDSPVYIVGVDDGDDDNLDEVVPSGDRGLSGGAISGIVLGGMATFLLTVGLLARRNKNDKKDDDQILKDRLELEEMEELNALETPQASNPPDKGGFKSEGAMAAGAMAGIVASSGDPRERQDSDAGSSGWSSREGLSSVDEDSKTSHSAGTGLVDPDDDPNLENSNSSYSGSSLQLTYSELDHAIQKGDWAAVGVTAALLASQSHGDPSEKKVNLQGDMHPDRAAELDRLVEAGDWAGVVAAAAKYDAQEAALSNPSDGGTSSVVSVASTRTGDSGYSGSGTAVTGASGVYTSTGTTNSDSGSRGRKLDEIRAEVEILVGKVVPEEKDNVDEMMMQFRGREEELVETLRTMQEREVAQKARLEGQKRAKRDARQTAEQKKLASAATAHDENDDTWMEEIDNTPAEPDVHLIDTSDDNEQPMNTEDAVPEEAPAEEEVPAEEKAPEMEAPEERVQKDVPEVTEPAVAVAAVTPPKSRVQKPKKIEDLQDALKRAIDSEDWEKVAETAAGLSGKYNYDSDDEDHAGSTTSTDKSLNASSSKSTDKSQKINELVEKGDWDGVVAVASQFAEDDYRSASTADDSRDIEERRARRQQRLKEEQEALEQADIWSAIADQTRQTSLDKAESDANQAATVAADWAIARSLNELKAADKAGRLSENGSDSDSSSDGSSDAGSNQEV